MKTPTNNFDHSMHNAIITHELADIDMVDSVQMMENQVLNSLPRIENTTTFSEDEDEREERVEVEQLIDAEYRELEDIHKAHFSDYNHDQFDIFPEVLKYHRRTLLKEFKLLKMPKDQMLQLH